MYFMGRTVLGAKAVWKGYCLEDVQDGSNLVSRQSLAIAFLARKEQIEAIYGFLPSFLKSRCAGTYRHAGEN